MSEKILVIDGNSIMNRAFYGIRPLTNKTGLQTNAVYGTVNIILKHLENIKPDYAAVAFDLKAPTFRHKMYSDYKAGRHAMPAELAEQVPYVKKVCELLGMHILSLEGYEADDILGTVADIANRNDDKVAYVLTGDRDSLQLISDKVNVLLAGNKDTVQYDVATFIDRYGVTPDVFVDVKALMGDQSDNIPGVAGIGEKTALSLVKQFGPLENIYSHIDDGAMTGAVKKKLADGRESAFLSKTLAAIDRNVPLDGLPDSIRYIGLDKSGLFDLFTELEFGALIKRLDLNKSAEITNDSTSDTHCSVTSETVSLTKLKSMLDACSLASMKMHTTAGDLELELSFDERSVYTLNVSTKDFLDLINSYSDRFILYDTKAVFSHFDIDPLTKFAFDIKLAAYVADSNVGSYEISRLALKYLGENIDDENADSALIYRLYVMIHEELEKTGALGVLIDIEQPLCGILSDMEKEGFAVDREGLISYGKVLGKASLELADRIYDAAGIEFNINSPKQLGEVLFERLGLPAYKKTKTGYSTSAEILEKLAPYHPIVGDILDYRQIVKLKGTYTDALAAIADENGVVHTNFNQTMTATGRLSSTEPNLQNIPVKTELGRELRRYFIPKKQGRVFIDADYSQIELRLLAEISGDENMINAFLSGTDIHRSTASEVFGVPIDKVTPELRKKAKAVNFGIVYGIGDYSLAQDINVSKKEAGEYIDGYLKSYPKIDAYLKNTVKNAYEIGYVSTLFGRRRYIPELTSGKAMLKKFGERVAMNSPIQGTAADIIKIAMINVFKALKDADIDAKLILQVHDELIIEVDEKDADIAARILKDRMENAHSTRVPLTCDVKRGNTWFECK